MPEFICPVCREILIRNEKTLNCSNNHSYDISKSGYVNLLMSQRSKNHGDDKLMVRARRDFLNEGYYEPLRDGLMNACLDFSGKTPVILDAGCGECYYTSGIFEHLKKNCIEPEIFAIDVSKNALDCSKSRGGDIKRAVASIFNIPVQNDFCDILLNIFAPFCKDEFLRVLKPEGIFIQVIPLENHLFSLKSAVYDKPYRNNVEDFNIDGFELIRTDRITGSVFLDSPQTIKNLFMMTPYYYKTSEKDFNKLDLVSSLNIETEFGIIIYRKIHKP